MKFTKEELNILGIRQWNQLKKDYHNSSILLGNGFSLNFSESLRYKYLYEHFIKECSSDAKSVFGECQTKNFEEVLHNIEVTKRVCSALKMDCETFEQLHNEIREGLIDSINKIHPKPSHIKLEKIKYLSSQFDSFNQIFTTNYDLFLYYIVLERKNKFGDFFFQQYNSKYRTCADNDTMKRNHIYYLHGALFLFSDGLSTLKITKPSNGWILELITEEISKGNYPLFISEGSSENKLKAIKSNPYLSFCLKALELNQDKTLVVFGQSLSEQDQHIVETIDGNYEKIAIAIRVEDFERDVLNSEIHRYNYLFKKTKCEFFDSTSLFDFESEVSIQPLRLSA